MDKGQFFALPISIPENEYLLSFINGEVEKNTFDNLLKELLYNLLFGSFDTFLFIDDSQFYPIIPGHQFFPPDAYVSSFGPIQSTVFIIGESPSFDELKNRRNFSGDYGSALYKEFLNFVDEKELQTWYCTNVFKFFIKKDKKQKILKFAKAFKSLVNIELALVQPDYIICLGRTALKLFTNSTLGSVFLNPEDYTYSIFSKGAIKTKTAKLFALPLTALHDSVSFLELQKGVRNFIEHYRGVSRKREELDFIVINKASKLNDLANTILSLPGLKKVAVDLEWQGHFYKDPGSFVRIASLCIEIPLQPEKKYIPVVIEVCDENGKFIFSPDKESLAEGLRKILLHPEVQIIGHNIISDIPWLKLLDVDITSKFVFPKDDRRENFCNPDYPGIFDTIIAHHSYNEDGEFDLEKSAYLLADIAPWSNELEDFIHQYLKKNKLRREDLAGFGPVPKDILYKYGAADVYNTFKLYNIHVKNLDARTTEDDVGYWRPYWNNMKALPGFLEMYETGVKIDIGRVMELQTQYSKKLDLLLSEFRKEINWPTFNFRSHPQCAALLFDDSVFPKGKEIRPAGAINFGLTPEKDTSGNKWGTSGGSPSTDQESCELLSIKDSRVRRLKELRELDQILKNVLRLPENGEITGGILFYVRKDGKIHPRYTPLRETRRCSCKEPNLQNLSNEKEQEYQKIMGEEYLYPIRSILTADDGYKFVKIDLSAAELLMMGVSSNCTELIEDYYKSTLPDDDENKLDIHSLVTVLAFGLDCPPTKEGLESIGKANLRIAGKRIIFGLNYGRGAESCLLQLQSLGIDVTLNDVVNIINTIYTRYPRVLEFQKQIIDRVHTSRWIRNCFGSYRHFPMTQNREILAKFEREALNFPCQSGVADAISIIMHNLYTHPLKKQIDYKLVLHNHDELVCLVRNVPELLNLFINTVVKECFKDKLVFYPHDLDGNLITNSKGYSFNYEMKVLDRFGGE